MKTHSNKKRNFYPAQVMRSLHGREHHALSAGEAHALNFFCRRGRRYGMAIAVSQRNPFQDVSGEMAAAIMDNTWTRIFLKVG